ncbi:aminotransferase class I/II-fold pyridoxal phosphate-dependent enzyme [Extensimonas sp. H3M7-6]|uniref:aminotransferase class I/II-fold pyridoxal phosphate-dependent enzyme n=1 Tax=Extensimonas soli TaxID=3031322 RepID=UPI00387E7C06
MNVASNSGNASNGARVHGGPDVQGVAAHDFSTNANACGPCPLALAAVQQADAAHYPDPAYTALRAQLAALHGVAPARIVIAGSASEFIYRITAWAAHALPPGARSVALPPHGYGDYAHAAQAWGLRVVHPVHEVGDAGVGGDAPVPGLHWACEPGSPLGQADAALAAWRAQVPGGGVRADQAAVDKPVDGAGDKSVDGLVDGAMDGAREGVRERLRDEPCDEPSNDEPAGAPATVRVLDCAYAPLRLSGQPSLDAAALDAVWRLYSPNKALGLTGVRAAYAIAPAGGQQRVAQMVAQVVAQLEALAPSWPLGAHGVALLAAWTQPAVHAWLQESLHTLRGWKARQTALLQAQGWQMLESEAPFFCARPPVADAADVPALCAQLRRHGVRLRDCSSFGLPGLVRLGVRAPASQDALLRAWGEVGVRQEAARPVEHSATAARAPDARRRDCPPAAPTR